MIVYLGIVLQSYHLIICLKLGDPSHTKVVERKNQKNSYDVHSMLLLRLVLFPYIHTCHEHALLKIDRNICTLSLYVIMFLSYYDFS